MLRPMDADGTCRYSTGRPGRENPPAVGVLTPSPMRPGSNAASNAAIVSRRPQEPRNLSMNFMVPNPSHLSYAAPHAIDAVLFCRSEPSPARNSDDLHRDVTSRLSNDSESTRTRRRGEWGTDGTVMASGGPIFVAELWFLIG